MSTTFSSDWIDQNQDAIGGISSGMQTLSSGFQQFSSYKIQAYQASVSAEIAKLNAKKTSLSLSSAYNKRAASDAVKSAAQNRRGGSVQAIADAGSDALKWDMDFAEASGDIAYSNRLAEQKSYNTASLVSGISGVGSAAADGYKSYMKEKSLLAPKDK